MTDPFRRPSPGLIRSSTSPAIAFTNQLAEENDVPQSPLELHDESGVDYSDNNPQQPQLLANQRQIVQSLDTIPYPTRPNQPNQPSAFAFRQESAHGSRMLHVNSPQRTNEQNRFATNIPSAFGRQRATPETLVQNDANAEANASENVENAEADVATTNVENLEDGAQTQDPQAERIKKSASARMWSQFSFNTCMLTCYILGYLFIDGIVPANVLFGFAFGFIFLALFGPLRRKGLYSDFDKLDVLFSVSHLLCLTAYTVLACLKFNGVGVPLTYVALLGLLILFCTCCKSSIEEPSPFKATLLLVKLFIWIQLIIASIKVDGLPLPWGTVFIPAYFTLVVLAFSSVLIIIGSLFAFFNVIRQEGMSAQLILGSLWYILNALYTAIWFGVVNGLVQLMDNQKEPNDIIVALRVGIIHCGVLFLYTVLFWRPLFKFQVFEVQSEMLGQEETEAQDGFGYDYESQNQNTNIRFQVSKDNKTYLTMISSTFYAYVGRHLKNNNNANSTSEIKSKIENAKLHKKHHILALDQPHHTDIANNMRNNQVSSPARVKGRNLDFSEGDIKASAIPPLVLKKGDSMRSNADSCVICFDNIPNGVFMDCGHGGICYECALDSWKKSDNCVFCRREINKVLKIVNVKPLNITKVVETTTKVVEKV